MVFELTEGQYHEQPVLPILMERSNGEDEADPAYGQT